MKYIDLHVHSKYSDGKLDIKEILDKAVENNVGVLSLTEHYNISSYRLAKSIINSNERYSKIELIPGIEIGASMLDAGFSKNHICHILAYFVSNKIYPLLAEYEEDRKKTNERIINLLKDQGIDITYGAVKRFAKGKSFGRYDIARYMSKQGLAYTPEDAYAKYLDYGQMAHIERRKMTPPELITKIIRCGGVPVIAHPKSLKLNYTNFTEFIKPLIDIGLAGLEIYYPRMKKEELETYEEICTEYNLIGTAGSDYHKNRDEVEIGLGINNNLCVSDYSIIKRLKEKKHEIDYGKK